MTDDFSNDVRPLYRPRSLMRAVLIAAVTLLAGCTTPAMMQNPQTGQTHLCTNITPGLFPIIAQAEINECADNYSALGWVKRPIKSVVQR